MIGKLIKNEFISTGRILGLIYVIEIALSVFAFISYKGENLMASVIGLVVLMLVTLAAFFATMLLIAMNYNSSMFSNQGYLTLTLPVKSGQLIFSKLFVYFIWMLLSYLSLIGIMGMSAYMMYKMGDESLAAELDMAAMFGEYMNLPSAGYIIQVVLFYASQFFIMAVVIVTELCFAVTVSQTRPFQKHSFLFALAAFGVLLFAHSKLQAFCMENTPFSIMLMDSMSFNIYFDFVTPSGNLVGLGGFIFDIVYSVGLIFATSATLYKVNIK